MNNELDGVIMNGRKLVPLLKKYVVKRDRIIQHTFLQICGSYDFPYSLGY